MGGALNKALIHIKKLMLVPVKINASMWAAVEVCIKLSILMNDKQLMCFVGSKDFKAHATRIFDISGMT